ncbi:hypothetical protein GIB67_041915 [Kingdonia uniflora]|uniref:CCHC-type domain-containing protein n=1 Tax=Kingdonia uniflora TaxID=39325 RepID=A0A7J7N0Y9_9MAGN|nr:hypothetical protein GIB67_041915 [Kingdonia uniflora]
MGPEDCIDPQPSSNCTNGSDRNKIHSSDAEPGEEDFQPSTSQLEEEIVTEENLRQDTGNENEDDQDMQKDVVVTGLVGGITVIEEDIKLTETTAMEEASKRKLGEFLQKWSEWHARHLSSSKDPNATLESGEDTYFPALHVFGQERASTVSFWMDNQTITEENERFIPLDGDSVPLYDRGFALGLTSVDGSINTDSGLENVEASRCFNCGSYSHALKECPKPRDNVAVNNARKQHNSKRGLSVGSRNPTRYYQSSPGGKYDGIRAGFLGSETRQLLGITELDPPPWLHRMRAIGYPPGYLDPDNEDQPSGITIFTEEEITKEEREEQEDGEILGTNNPEPQKKMSVTFPGINAPIPENADEKRWSTSLGSSGFDSSRNQYQHNRPSEAVSRGHYNDAKRSRDDGPPGVDFSMPSYIPRFTDHEPNYTSQSHSPRLNPIPSRYTGYDPKHLSDSNSPRLNPIPAGYSGYDPNGNQIPRSPSLGRSQSDRGRRSHLVHEGSPNHIPYDSSKYSSPNDQPPQGYNSLNFGNRARSSNHQNPSLDLPPQKDRYFHLKRKSGTDEDDHLGQEEEALTPFSCSQHFREEVITALSPVVMLPSSKKVSRLQSILAIFGRNRSASSLGLGTKVVGTLFGHRRGKVKFAFQEDPKTYPAFLIELATPTSSLIREMASGLVRIALESDKKREKKRVRLLEESLWRSYCNGKKCGVAIRRECGVKELKVLKAIGPVSMGAGVFPGNVDESEGELMYMRAKYERVVGSKDSETFYMMNPNGNGGPELSIYLHRV